MIDVAEVLEPEVLDSPFPEALESLLSPSKVFESFFPEAIELLESLFSDSLLETETLESLEERFADGSELFDGCLLPFCSLGGRSGVSSEGGCSGNCSGGCSVGCSDGCSGEDSGGGSCPDSGDAFSGSWLSDIINVGCLYFDFYLTLTCKSVTIQI